MNSTIHNLVPDPNGNWLKLVLGNLWGYSRQWRIGPLVHSLDYMDWLISTCTPFLPTCISSVHFSWMMVGILSLSQLLIVDIFWFDLILFIFYISLFFSLFMKELEVQISSLFSSRNIEFNEKKLVSAS